MTIPRIPIEENLRLAELHRYEILDTPPEPDFDEMALLASQICKTSFAAISFIDRTRHWSKAVVGLKKTCFDRNISFCSHTILGDDLLEIENTFFDERFSDSPLVTEYPKIGFYAGVPLITSKGFKLGTLSVSDYEPRKLSAQQILTLKILSRHTVKLMEMRVINKEISDKAEIQQRIISVISHDIRSPLYTIKTFLDLNAENVFTHEEQTNLLSALSVNVSRTLQLLDNLVEWGKIQLAFSNHTDILNLRDVVNECIEQAELNMLIKNNLIVNEVEPDVLVNADKEGIQFILRNLISNANKFTENGSIQITFLIKNEKCYLKVRDTGVGLEMEKASQLLDNTGLFHTSGTQNEKGNGLGLSLIKSYLNKTDNHIEIKSKVNQGTSVCFSLCSVHELVSVFA